MPEQSLLSMLQAFGHDRDTANEILQQSEQIQIPAKTCLIRQGESLTHVFFLIEGVCQASYFTDHGKQFIKEFYWENDFLIGFESLLKSQPALFQLESLSESTLFKVSVDELHQWRAHLPRVWCHIVEQQLLHKEFKERFMLLHSPEERYQQFCQRYPELEKQVADYQIASYLGITPISLSRIKKRSQLNKG